MRHISSVLHNEITLVLEQEDDEQGAPWYGDPWTFDVRCVSCGAVFSNSYQVCPYCDSEEATPIE